MTTIETIAEWAHSLRLEDVPERVLALCRAQRRSVLGAVAAAAAAAEGDGAAARVRAGVNAWAAEGPAPLVGSERRVRVEDAVYAAAALSVALDFDDYLCFGHTGHSAVLAPVLAAAETGSEGSEQLVAQVIANEVEGRLGGACLLGPMNGQMWAFIHTAGAALAVGHLMGLDRRRLAHALALAVAHPPRATVPGFMAPDSKLLVAAEPTVAGIRAARLAAAGVTGPLDALDHDQGLVGVFSYTPLRGALGGLGQGWATTTLCVKPYPGCAYIDTTVDALLELLPLEAGEVEAVVVEAGMLTCGMDALSRPYAVLDPPTPVTVTFSIPWSVAIVALAGRLSPEETNEAWLAEHRHELRALARRVRLRHDPELTARGSAAFTRVLPPRQLGREGGGPRRLVSAVRRMRSAHPGVRLRPADLLGFVRAAGRGRGRVLGDAGRARTWWDQEALDTLAFAFPARVRVRLRDGSERVAEAEVPRGGAGNHRAPPEAVAREKLATWGPRLWGEERTRAIDQAIESDDAKLYDLL